MRAKAFETDDYALRCYIDQLPVDRCLFCAVPTEPRQLHVAGPLHQWSSLQEMADTGSVLDKVAVGAALLGGKHALAGVTAKSQQTQGRVSMAVCWKCAPSPKSPSIVSGVAWAVTVVAIVLGQVWPAVIAGVIAAVASIIAYRRTSLAVGEIDEDDFMFKLHGVDDGVKAEVIALGALPHPNNQTVAQLRG